MIATEEVEMCDDYQIRLDGVRVDGGGWRPVFFSWQNGTNCELTWSRSRNIQVLGKNSTQVLKMVPGN